VIVIPNEHFENLYAIPEETLAAVYATAKRVARALRSTYGCEGTSTRQHNEPAGGQDVWHFHVHVYPRYPNDRLYENHRRTRWPDAEERAPYAALLREALR
jgi:histidine triad (HIT) family protein